MSVSVERVAIVFLASAVGCLVLGRRAIQGLTAMRWLQPMRHEDCPPLKPLQASKQGTPTMGGLLVLGIAAGVAAVFGGLSRFEGWLVLGASVALGIVGLRDDRLKLIRPNAAGLRCLPKLLMALGIGGLVGVLLAHPRLGYQRIFIPWLGTGIEPGWLWVPLAAVVVAGCSHAVNLTDGMDGLAVGTLAIAFGAVGMLGSDPQHFTLVPSGSSHSLVAIWCASLAGACAGFLWFNCFPASVFLGDVGALGLGAALGVLALLAHAALGLLVVGGIFVAEALSVILQVASYRWRNHRRIFRVAPLHHHFHLGGIAEQKVVVRFWIVGLLLAALGLTAFAHS
ncbi:MAG: phospho-N-acetylmuramoyl-pentapeptide-transferase [Candidatus Omnitrophica bacterium]|nr:phospho-N-acetylmuramoyl-pentapeptide-transferase [Candidatus Omnitrophota bacterium]